MTSTTGSGDLIMDEGTTAGLLNAGNIVQLTETPSPTRHWTWHAPLTEDVVTFGTLPDPRDARIAELEAALNKIVSCCENRDLYTVNKVRECRRIATIALMPEPEASMRETVEELPA